MDPPTSAEGLVRHIMRYLSALLSVLLPITAMAATPDAAVIDACNQQAPSQIAQLEQTRKQRGEAGFTALFFTPDGELCNFSRQFGVVGDPIDVFVLRVKNAQNHALGVQFAPCAVEPAGISIYAQGAFPATIGPSNVAATAADYEFVPLLPHRCFNTSVDITITDTTSNTQIGRYTLTQYDRYRATLQVGSVFTSLHDNTYGLRADGANSRIFNKGPVKTGPEYYSSVVIYGLPHYLSELRANAPHYLGRDIVNDQSLSDRIGGVVAASASHPAQRFAAGLSIEVIRGVNVVGLVEFAQVTRLVGYNEGDIFTGAENTIPVRNQWNRHFVAGLSLDFRYVTALFSRQ